MGPSQDSATGSRRQEWEGRKEGADLTPPLEEVHLGAGRQTLEGVRRYSGAQLGTSVIQKTGRSRERAPGRWMFNEGTRSSVGTTCVFFFGLPRGCTLATEISMGLRARLAGTVTREANGKKGSAGW
jgi:hypothetical protein